MNGLTRWPLLCLGLGFIVMMGCARASKEGSSIVAAPELTSGAAKILGALGKPLGTVMEIEAVVVSERENNTMVAGTIFVLRVDKVDGAPIARPVNLRFKVEGKTVIKVAPGESELTKLLTDMQTPGGTMRIDPLVPMFVEGPTITPAEAEAIRANYVGSRHRLVVYETGVFWGMPDNLPPDGESFISSQRFGFHSHLVVLAQR